ncbi:MAG: polyketide synthase dehydratase domain-containing protein, partial [Mycobacterium sp.]
VMPGAGFAEIALAAGQEALDRPATEIEVEVEVEQMLPLDDHTKLTTQLTHQESTGEFLVEIHSRSDSGTWTRHASATVRTAEPVAQARLAESAADGTPVSPADFYTALRRTGAHHAPAFAALTRIVRSSGAADTEIVLPEEATPHRGLTLHPVMLDAALQGLAAAMSDEVLSNATDITFLPVGFTSIRVFGEIGRRARCRAELVSVAEDSGDAMGRVTLADEAGIVLAVVDGVHLKCIQRGTVPLPLSQKIFDTRWVESTVSASGSPKGSWLALADGASAL